MSNFFFLHCSFYFWLGKKHNSIFNLSLWQNPCQKIEKLLTVFLWSFALTLLLHVHIHTHAHTHAFTSIVCILCFSKLHAILRKRMFSSTFFLSSSQTHRKQMEIAESRKQITFMLYVRHFAIKTSKRKKICQFNSVTFARNTHTHTNTQRIPLRWEQWANERRRKKCAN